MHVCDCTVRFSVVSDEAAATLGAAADAFGTTQHRLALGQSVQLAVSTSEDTQEAKKQHIGSLLGSSASFKNQVRAQINDQL